MSEHTSKTEKNTRSPQNKVHVKGVKALYPQMNKSMQRWGKHHHACYEVFQPIVEMKFAIVERWAEELVRLEADKVGYQRQVIDLDRQKAVWALARKGISGLEPALLHFARVVVQALQELPKTGQWPKNVPIPPECRAYVVLSLIYVHKTSTPGEVAMQLDVPKRSFCKIRSRAIREVVLRLLAWEQQAPYGTK